MLKKGRWLFYLSFLLFFSLDGISAAGNKDSTDRTIWLNYLDKTARPVLSALAEDRLKATMPVNLSVRTDNAAQRLVVTYLEAWGRTLSGIAPWLNGEGGLPEEVLLRNQYREWAIKAVANSVNPAAKDYMLWTGGQSLVDASFFALGLIRCPWLWEHLPPGVRQQVVVALKMTRTTMPGNNNWILFPAVIEAFFCKYGMDYDQERIEYAVRQFSTHWYLGDGTFSDGPPFHQDYYNSYVIQPFLSAIMSVVNGKTQNDRSFEKKMVRISQRYAEIQERMIGVDGSFPVTGRSITYRCGAFHALADITARKQLPPSLPPGQVRSALTAVIRRTLGSPGTFDSQGWLKIGLAGHQERLADSYITGGSLYLCTEVFLPLGLGVDDAFWTKPAEPWTAVKVWGGSDNVDADHALEISEGFHLVWADEFNKDGPPDSANWGFERGFVRNHEAQWYQPENAWCKDGHLILEARKENKPNPLYEAGSRDWRRMSPQIGYTSASLLTRGRHAFQYGRFEMRARIDVDSGLWPAFWTLGEKGAWPSNGEIDIMEYYRRMLLANVATGSDKKGKALWWSHRSPLDSLGGAAWAQAYHVWRMDWDEKDIRLSVDGSTLLEAPVDSLYDRDGSGVNPFRQPHYIIINLAVGGDSGGDPAASVFPKQYEIDYIRVYQKN